jgi:hypothetical protein
MDLVAKIKLITDNIKEQLERKTPTFPVFGAAVEYLLKDNMPLGVILQVRKSNDFFEVSTMPVKVACDYQLACIGQMNDIAPAVLGRIVQFHPFFAKLNHFRRHRL